MPRRLDEDAERRLTVLLERQAMVVSRVQAHAAGLSDAVIRTRVEAGVWQRGYPGTFVAHNGEISCVTRVWSALLYAGEGALAGYETAAYLHGLVAVPPAVVHVTVPSTRRVAQQPGLRVHLNKRAGDQCEPGSAPARTSVEETVLDLMARTTRPDDVVAVLTNACRGRKTVSERLLAAMALRKKLRHRVLATEVLEAIGYGVHSVLEWRYLVDVERRHGLPRGSRQAGRRRAGRQEWIDVAYREHGLIVELDGEAFHAGEQRRLDRARDNAAAASGQVTLRYGWSDVTVTPCETARQVAAALRSRGWTGAFRECPRCRS